LKEILNDFFRTISENGRVTISYHFDDQLHTVAIYRSKFHDIVVNPKEINSFIRDNLIGKYNSISMAEFKTIHFIERLLAHETIHYLQTEIAKALNKRGERNLVTNLFDRDTNLKLYNEATKEANRGFYKITPEETFYARVTRMVSLEHFFREFEAYAFNYSYREDRELYRKKNKLEFYERKVNFNKLFSENLSDKARQSYSLYKTVAYYLARELAREIGNELSVKIDGSSSFIGLYFYFGKYRELFIKRAHEKLGELLNDGVKRKKFFQKNLLDVSEYNKNPKAYETIYETYKRAIR